MRKHSDLFFLGIGALIASLSGCAIARVSLPSFTATLSRGYYENASTLAKGEIGARNTYHDLLWNLQAGSLERILQRYESSNLYFDRAEDGFRYFDQQAVLGRGISSSGSIFLNDSALPYAGKHHDRVMVNVYKALNFAALGDFKNARVEFNRALVRQNEAKAFFADDAQRLTSERERHVKVSGTGADVVEATMDNPDLDKIIAERYKNLEAFEAYRDFVNPFATYMAGLFFWLEGDREKAVDLLKEAYGMSGQNQVAAESFARAARGERPAGELWVILENGLAPERQEISIDIPVILQRSSIRYVGTALVNLTRGREAYPSLLITTRDGERIETTPLASMESVIVHEFKKELPSITAREVARVALKTYFQYQMYRNYGFLAGLSGGIYQYVTTAVDIRTWSALPNDFQVARLSIPRDRAVTFSAPGCEAVTINLPPDADNMILYVRAVASNVPPAFELIVF